MRTRILVGAALAAVMLGTSPGPASAASSDVAYWPMNELSGSAMTDGSGFGNHGTRFAVITREVSPYTYGYRFNGTSSHVDVPNAASLNPGGSNWRVGVSVKLPTTLAAGDYNMLQKGISTSPGGSYKIEIRGGTSTKALGQPRCTFRGSGGSLMVASRKQINNNAWHRVVCTKTTSGLSITVDGTVTAKTGSIGSITNDSKLTIGYKPTGDHYFLGSLDEVRIARLPAAP